MIGQLASDVIIYAGALFNNWAAFMTGGIPVALFVLMERLVRRRPFSPKTFFLIFIVFGFTAASYKTWHDEFATRIERSAAREAHIKQLKIFYVRADNFYRQLVSMPKNITAENYKNVQKQIDAFSQELEHWVSSNLGPAANAHLMVSPGKLKPVAFGISQDHDSTIAAIVAVKEGIDDLISNPIWDDRLPR
jgi:hypothetical protein